ncbi:alanine racemase [Cronobacter sakazakii]|nr:alanine racemase [Cronobacter sakazakii]MDQ9173991.1 alanine racemase [Cronobacter sakazakii]MDQ9177274.1 alanine racemase [Cronobacter sakazakii]
MRHCLKRAGRAGRADSGAAASAAARADGYSGAGKEYARQFAVACEMAAAFTALKARYPTVDTLSLGMSDDMEAAIAAGSTMVRIGTAIFGARDYARATQQ